MRHVADKLILLIAIAIRNRPNKGPELHVAARNGRESILLSCNALHRQTHEPCLPSVSFGTYYFYADVGSTLCACAVVQLCV